MCCSAETLAAVLLTALLSMGCASWEPPPEQPVESLPMPQVSPDSVVLEFQLVHLSEPRSLELGSMWDSIDEQHLAVDLRRRLAGNGIRCGLVESDLPPVLREAIAASKDSLQQFERAEQAAPDAGGNYRQLSCRAGRPYRLAVTEPSPERVVMFSEDSRVSGRSFSEARGYFSLAAEPLGDGRARLSITPLIESGKIRPRYSAGPAEFFIDSGQDQEEFAFLRIETVLVPGATLVVAAAPDPKGIGGWYFSNQESRSVMLVRLLQTQHNDLFSPQPTMDRLASPLEIP